MIIRNLHMGVIKALLFNSALLESNRRQDIMAKIIQHRVEEVLSSSETHDFVKDYTKELLSSIKN